MKIPHWLLNLGEFGVRALVGLGIFAILYSSIIVMNLLAHFLGKYTEDGFLHGLITFAKYGVGLIDTSLYLVFLSIEAIRAVRKIINEPSDAAAKTAGA
jgi:hypothetical protein